MDHFSFPKIVNQITATSFKGCCKSFFSKMGFKLLIVGQSTHNRKAVLSKVMEFSKESFPLGVSRKTQQDGYLHFHSLH